MFVKVNQIYTATLLVMDINNNRVLTDTPVAIVKNIQNNMYFNGIAWQTSMAQLVMPHVANGVYSKQVSFAESGVYRVTTRSDMYSVEKVDTIEVYDGNLMRYSWLVGSSFMAKYEGLSNSEVVQVRIMRNTDAMFWNGTAWTLTDTMLPMPLLSGNIYAYSFIPGTEGEYAITITSGDKELFYIIEAASTGDNVAPIFIDRATFRSLDGTDSTTVDQAGNKLSNVTVSVFDSATKEVVAKTISNSSGEWNMMIKPGEYYFMFEKDGYMSVGFERMVV